MKVQEMKPHSSYNDLVLRFHTISTILVLQKELVQSYNTNSALPNWEAFTSRQYATRCEIFQYIRCHLDKVTLSLLTVAAFP